jgi:hypothetical protein
MVDKRHPRPSEPVAVPLYGFRPPVSTPYGLEVNTVEDFFAQHDDWPWNPPRPGRATFHYLILVTEGELRHDVDHVTRIIAPGQWLWVRPGHAQCWHPPGDARGRATGTRRPPRTTDPRSCPCRTARRPGSRLPRRPATAATSASIIAVNTCMPAPTASASKPSRKSAAISVIATLTRSGTAIPVVSIFAVW